MAAHAPEAQGSGTWEWREAAAEWRRGAAARLAALGPATEMMLDRAGVKTGSRVLDVGAGAGDSTRRRFQSLSDAMQFARGPLPLRELMIRLTPSEQGQAWTEIERALTQFVGPNGYDSPCEVLIGVGVK